MRHDWELVKEKGIDQTWNTSTVNYAVNVEHRDLNTVFTKLLREKKENYHF